MDELLTYEVLSSRTRAKIASLISERPRSLDELKAATGISIQGVLKHLDKLKGLGIAVEIDVSGKEIGVRRVYGVKSMRFGDYSAGSVVVAKSGQVAQVKAKEGDEDLERLAEESVVLRQRVKENVRRLARLIDELRQNEDRIRVALESAELDPEERLVIQTLLTEESAQQAEALLVRHYGLRGGRRSIDKALAKARRIVG